MALSNDIFLSGWICSLVCLTGVFLEAPQAEARVRYVKMQRAGMTKKIIPKELSVRISTRGPYTEGWSIWAWDSKGWMIHGMLLVAKMHPFLGIRAGLQLTIRTPKGKIHHKFIEYKKNKLKWHPKRLLVFIGKSYFNWKNNKGRVKILFPGFGIHLRMFGQLEGFRSLGGRLKLRKRQFMNLVFAPKVKVKGTIRVNGKDISFNGIGYADRSWQNEPHRIGRRWYNTRAFHKDYSVIATHLKPPKGWGPRGIPGLSVAYKGKWLFHHRGRKVRFYTTKIKEDKGSGYRVPSKVRYFTKAPDGAMIKVQIIHKKQYHRLDVLSHVPAALRFFIKKMITNPFLFRSRVEVQLTIYKSGKRKSVRFPGYSEWVFLNR